MKPQLYEDSKDVNTLNELEKNARQRGPTAEDRIVASEA